VSPAEVASWNHLKPTARFAAGSTAVLFLPRSTSLARAPAHPGAGRVVARTPAGKARVAKAPAAKTRTAQTPNARSGTHVATSKAPPRKAIVAHKGAGTPTKSLAKTKVAQP
jgi:hypothetical protein